MVWECEDTTSNPFQLPKTKAKQSPAPIPKETLIKENCSEVSDVRVCLCAFRGVLRARLIPSSTAGDRHSSTKGVRATAVLAGMSLSLSRGQEEGISKQVL